MGTDLYFTIIAFVKGFETKYVLIRLKRSTHCFHRLELNCKEGKVTRGVDLANLSESPVLTHYLNSQEIR